MLQQQDALAPLTRPGFSSKQRLPTTREGLPDKRGCWCPAPPTQTPASLPTGWLGACSEVGQRPGPGAKAHHFDSTGVSSARSVGDLRPGTAWPGCPSLSFSIPTAAPNTSSGSCTQVWPCTLGVLLCALAAPGWSCHQCSQDWPGVKPSGQGNAQLALCGEHTAWATPILHE